MLDLGLKCFLHSGVMPLDLTFFYYCIRVMPLDLIVFIIVSDLCLLIWLFFYCIRVMPLDLTFFLLRVMCLDYTKNTLSCSISDLTEIHQICNEDHVSEIPFWFFNNTVRHNKKNCWYQDKMSLIGFTVNLYSSLLKIKWCMN